MGLSIGGYLAGSAFGTLYRDYLKYFKTLKGKGFSDYARAYQGKELVSVKKTKIMVGYNQSSSTGRIRRKYYQDIYLYTYSYPRYKNISIANPTEDRSSFYDEGVNEFLGGTKERLG